jgi:hypothetical protein
VAGDPHRSDQWLNAVEALQRNAGMVNAVEALQRNAAMVNAVEALQRNAAMVNAVEALQRNAAMVNAVEALQRNAAMVNAVEALQRNAAMVNAVEALQRNAAMVNAVEALQRNPAMVNAVEALQRNPGMVNAVQASQPRLATSPTVRVVQAIQAVQRNLGTVKALQAFQRQPATSPTVKAVQAVQRNLGTVKAIQAVQHQTGTIKALQAFQRQPGMIEALRAVHHIPVTLKAVEGFQRLLRTSVVTIFEAADRYVEEYYWVEQCTRNPAHPPPVLFIVSSFTRTVGLPLYEAVMLRSDDSILLEALERVYCEPRVVEQLQEAVHAAPHLNLIQKRHLITALRWLGKKNFVDAYPPFYNGLEPAFFAIARHLGVIDHRNRFLIRKGKATKVDDVLSDIVEDPKFKRFLRSWIFDQRGNAFRHGDINALVDCRRQSLLLAVALTGWLELFGGMDNGRISTLIECHASSLITERCAASDVETDAVHGSSHQLTITAPTATPT